MANTGQDNLTGTGRLHESEEVRRERKEKERKGIERIKEMLTSRTAYVTLDDRKKTSRYDAFEINKLPEKMVQDDHYWYLVLQALTEDIAGIKQQYVYHTKVKRLLPESDEPFLVVGQQALIHAKKQYESEFDALTKLANRGRFQRSLERLDVQTAIVVFDIDDFKLVNDIYGHPAGDEVLALLAENLMSIAHELFGTHVRPYRYGGEEFTLLINLEESGLSIEDLHAKLIALFSRLTSKKYVLTSSNGEKIDYPLSLSVGYQVFDPQLRASPGKKFAEADKALYDAKGTKNGEARIDSLGNKVRYHIVLQPPSPGGF